MPVGYPYSLLLSWTLPSSNPSTSTPCLVYGSMALSSSSTKNHSATGMFLCRVCRLKEEMFEQLPGCPFPWYLLIKYLYKDSLYLEVNRKWREGLRVFMKNNTTLRGKYHPSTKPPVFYVDMKCDSDPKFTKNYQMFLCLVLSDLAFKRRLLGQMFTWLQTFTSWWYDEKGGGGFLVIYIWYILLLYILCPIFCYLNIGGRILSIMMDLSLLN